MKRSVAVVLVLAVLALVLAAACFIKTFPQPTLTETSVATTTRTIVSPSTLTVETPTSFAA